MRPKCCRLPQLLNGTQSTPTPLRPTGAARQQQREEAERQAFEAGRQLLLADAKLSAVARFWELLADFVQVGAPPADAGWLERDGNAQVPRQHPFIHAAGTGEVLQLDLTPRLL